VIRRYRAIYAGAPGLRRRLRQQPGR
jgi:hypothetical protein